MLNALSALVPIVIALALGWLLGRALPSRWLAAVPTALTLCIWALLFAVGWTCADTLAKPGMAGRVLVVGLTFAFCATLGAWLLIWACLGRRHAAPRAERNGTASAWGSLRAAFATLAWVAVGAAAARYMGPAFAHYLPLPNIAQLIDLLVFLVGMELAKRPLSTLRMGRAQLTLPLLALAGSYIGGLAAAALTSTTWKTALALSSGFGWMSLSSGMISAALGSDYGAVAMVTDLFRELIAIVLLFVAGATLPMACIGATGATAMDATLPIVRQTCPPDTLRYALASGFVLSMLAPLLISVFLA
ncbi:lysine exporter LysO family protein [Pseudomonas sp. RIT-PI-S]|uniref:lysine exporter LysO family protein n=1 Tax=Pseudomonas sp. RIT-PI-S TaxID=3035295 RepID=UPI0021DAF5DE|nr:lysine exporter LysO family protein [Pseudomonas sp. RIT-PI-S]